MPAIQPETFLEHLLVDYRWIVVITTLLPLSFIWSVFFTIRNYVVFKLNSAPKKHDKKVKEVQRQIKEWLASDRSTRLCTARPTWQTISFRGSIYKKTFTKIKVNLVDILDVDSKNMTVRCEPLVTMGQISRALKPLGFALAVVPELNELTVGGMVMGTGVETSSHIYGLFQHICLEYEMVLADGSVVTCNKDKNPDLFYAIPWSYGTLGFLTSVIIKIVPAKEYVRLEYHSYTNLPDIAKKLQEESMKPKPHQFLEGILFTKDEGVVMTGDMVDKVGDDGKLNPIGKWHSKWFFTQVLEHLKKHQNGYTKSAVEYIPLRDYYHRHSKSFFWELQDIVPFGNSIIFRYLLGWLMPPEISLIKLTQPETVKKFYDRAHVIQDMLVPIECLEKSVQVFHDEIEVYPVWLCPFKIYNNPGQLRVASTDWQMFIDIGVYGVPKSDDYETVKSTRSIQKFVMDHQGFQMLYADTYTTEEEFRKMFDHTLYDKVRSTLPYCREAFPEIYGKVNRSVRE